MNSYEFKIKEIERKVKELLAQETLSEKDKMQILYDIQDIKINSFYNGRVEVKNKVFEIMEKDLGYVETFKQIEEYMSDE